MKTVKKNKKSKRTRSDVLLVVNYTELGRKNSKINKLTISVL